MRVKHDLEDTLDLTQLIIEKYFNSGFTPKITLYIDPDYISIGTNGIFLSDIEFDLADKTLTIASRSFDISDFIDEEYPDVDVDIEEEIARLTIKQLINKYPKALKFLEKQIEIINKTANKYNVDLKFTLELDGTFYIEMKETWNYNHRDILTKFEKALTIYRELVEKLDSIELYNNTIDKRKRIETIQKLFNIARKAITSLRETREAFYLTLSNTDSSGLILALKDKENENSGLDILEIIETNDKYKLTLKLAKPKEKHQKSKILTIENNIIKSTKDLTTNELHHCLKHQLPKILK